MTDNHQTTAARLLLKDARVLYEKYEAGRPKPFNIFSVLALERKEVELHSRVLATLLDHKEKEIDGTDAKRKNLADFLRSIGIKDFKQDQQDNIRVEREKAHIDIRVTNDDSQQAVIIENKVDAEDSPKQLETYWEQTTKEGYRDVWLVYLTLDGREPSPESLGKAKIDDDRLKCISYKDHVAKWLPRCQQRAYANPELRESIAQYLQTVRNITGANYSEEYMNKLSEYLLDNKPTDLALARDLGDAFHKAMTDLQCRLWKKIQDEVARSINPRFKNTAVTWSPDKVRSWYEKRRNYERWYGVYFSLGGDVSSWAMGVEIGPGSLFYGVTAYEGDSYKKLHDLLYKDGMERSDHWPCFIIWDKTIDFRYPSLERLQHIAEKGVPDFLQECTQELIDGLTQMWDKIKETDLAT